jgi:cytochrome c556
MDDHFLHHLRRAPPAAFAVRLKWQLARPVPTRTSRARLLLLVFAIFGTAFALVSPQARRAFGDLFHNVTGTAHTVTAESGAGAVPRGPISTPGGIDGPRGAPLRRFAAAARVSSGQGSLPAERPQSPQSVIPAAQPIDEAFVGSRVVVASSSTSTPQLRGVEAAVLTRRGLFKVMSLVFAPLGSMRQGRTPVDMRIARINAYRLNRLSSMIPEVFQYDTSASDADTRALNIIWSQGEDFRSKAEALTLAADALDMAGATGDADTTLMAIGRIGKACEECHLVYRTN